MQGEEATDKWQRWLTYLETVENEEWWADLEQLLFPYFNQLLVDDLYDPTEMIYLLLILKTSIAKLKAS